MMRGLHILLLLLLPLVPQAAPAVSGGPSADPRIGQASALLADASGYPEAISLYRAVLQDDPGSHEARLWLARVLAWQRQYDVSLAEFARLLEDAPTTEIRLERAEVLSWAGRYDESERALLAALEADPGNARAARGLARVYSWSGRTIAADDAYARALRLEENLEARGEWEALLAEYRPRVSSVSGWLGDSDDFERARTGVVGEVHLDLLTPLRVELSYLRTAGKVADPQSGGLSSESTDGSEVLFTLGRRLNEAWRGELSFGRRRWSDARDHWVTGGRLEYSPDPNTALALWGHWGDALEATDSYRAVTEGVGLGESSLSLWKRLPAGFELYSALSGGWFDDGNSRYGGVLSVSYRPSPRHDLRFEVSGSGLGYSDRSPLYYDPELDAQGMLLAHYGRTLPSGFELFFTLGAGVAHGEEAEESSTGPAWRAGTGLEWKLGGWRAGLHGHFSQSQRGESYRSSRVSLELGRRF